jgi:hypothetical protein
MVGFQLLIQVSFILNLSTKRSSRKMTVNEWKAGWAWEDTVGKRKILALLPAMKPPFSQAVYKLSCCKRAWYQVQTCMELCLHIFSLFSYVVARHFYFAYLLVGFLWVYCICFLLPVVIPQMCFIYLSLSLKCGIGPTSQHSITVLVHGWVFNFGQKLGWTSRKEVNNALITSNVVVRIWK